MKIYTLSYLKNDNERIDVESSPDKKRIINSKKRYESVYKRTFSVRVKNISIKMRNHNEN